MYQFIAQFPQSESPVTRPQKCFVTSDRMIWTTDIHPLTWCLPWKSGPKKLVIRWYERDPWNPWNGISFGRVGFLFLGYFFSRLKHFAHVNGGGLLKKLQAVLQKQNALDNLSSSISTPNHLRLLRGETVKISRHGVSPVALWFPGDGLKSIPYPLCTRSLGNQEIFTISIPNKPITWN